MRALAVLLATIGLAAGQPWKSAPLEWWYYTGNLRAAGGHRYGFELVFFRRAQPGGGVNPSAWRVDNIYLAHLALTDIDRGTFQYNERFNRAGPGIAGMEADRIWNGNWESRQEGNTRILSAVSQDIRLHLRLRAEKPPVAHAENYVSVTRLGVEGELNGIAVSGQAWTDHQWFQQLLTPEQRGWDWFSAQMDDGTELMLYQIRRKDGTVDLLSSGTFVGRDGRAVHLLRSDFTIEPLEYWKSAKSGARYPVKWRIAIPSLKLSLECSAAIPNQELDLRENTYWEGAASYTSGAVRGVGYVEMTGYRAPLRM